MNSYFFPKTYLLFVFFNEDSKLHTLVLLRHEGQDKTTVTSQGLTTCPWIIGSISSVSPCQSGSSTNVRDPRPGGVMSWLMIGAASNEWLRELQEKIIFQSDGWKDVLGLCLWLWPWLIGRSWSRPHPVGQNLQTISLKDKNKHVCLDCWLFSKNKGRSG